MEILLYLRTHIRPYRKVLAKISGLLVESLLKFHSSSAKGMVKGVVGTTGYCPVIGIIQKDFLGQKKQFLNCV